MKAKQSIEENILSPTARTLIKQAKQEEREKLINLIEELTDSDDCSYDHHGYCQTHSWFSVNPVCPHKRAQKLLKESEANA